MRPQWKLVTSDLREASRVFAEACKQNYLDSTLGKAPEPEEAEVREVEPEAEDSDDERPMPDGETVDVKSDPDEILEATGGEAETDSTDEDEQIVVTRPEDQHDPEADAEFDRELARLMTESVESRKFERKPLFDVPLPMRRTARDGTTNTAAEDSGGESPALVPAIPTSTMKFSLLSKKGNRQQVSSTSRLAFVGMTLLIQTDSRYRPAVRLALCSRHAIATTGRASGATAHQESGAQLRTQ